jgi:hypothetical protein
VGLRRPELTPIRADASPRPLLTSMPKSGTIMPTLGAKVGSRKSRRNSLADALFTKTQQRVLRVLFGQPERSFYASELIREAGTGSGAAQRELAKLEESGLIVSRRIGHQKHYEANAASDIDLMIISDSLTYGEVFGALERVTRAVGRKVNPTVYTAAEFLKRAQTENAFVTRVLEQPKLWVIGSDDDLPVAA